jgi:hypothetical protein
MSKREKRIKTILVYNRSDVPAHYFIRKAASIASGDIHFREGKMGIIKEFGMREVDFAFCPTMPGIFAEKLVVENLNDRDNDQFVNVKATIRKPANFFSINFANNS